jgi:hypothetical protein
MIRIETHRIAVSLLSVALTLFLVSCFDVRSPADPTTTSGFLTPTEPSIAITNLQTAYSGLNADNFIRCFNAEKFQFLPDPTIPGAVSLFTNWTLRKEERDVIINIKSKSTSTLANQLIFTNPQQNFITTDSIEYIAFYDLQVYTSDTSFDASRLKGKSRFIMVRNPNTNEWRINLWQDNRLATGERCWTELKQRFIVP